MTTWKRNVYTVQEKRILKTPTETINKDTTYRKNYKRNNLCNVWSEEFIMKT